MVYVSLCVLAMIVSHCSRNDGLSLYLCSRNDAFSLCPAIARGLFIGLSLSVIAMILSLSLSLSLFVVSH